MLKITRTRPSFRFFEEIEHPRELLLGWASLSVEDRRQRRAPINHDMFRYGDLVDAVASDFDGHCVYCERFIGTTEGIGHFRPPSISHQENGEDFADHYSWLAFEWLNLILICRRCQKFKSDHFPLFKGRRSRFLATFREVREEESPSLIDPTSDNPANHISYLMTGECFSKKGSAKSISTIEILQLNEPYLLEERFQAIAGTLQVCRNSLKGLDVLPEDFLGTGSFLGARRDVVVRTLSEYGAENPPVTNSKSAIQRLRQIIKRGDSEEQGRIIATMDLMAKSDRIRLTELERQNSRSPKKTVILSVRESPEVHQWSTQGELRSLIISNFRAIDEVTIPFPKVRSMKAGVPCLLLLGENAVGKSTCLSAMALALLGTKQSKKLKLRFHELARSNRRDFWNLWGRQPIEVNVQFHDEGKLASFYYDPVKDRIDGTSEQSTLVLGYGPHRYFASARSRRRAQSAERVRSLFDPIRPLPDPSDWLQGLSGWKFEEVARTIRTILPIGDDDRLVNDSQAGICVLAQNQLTPVSQLSEGYRSVFALVADICRSLLEHWSKLESAQAIILIDEIETHLHPRWKMRVIPSLRQAFPRAQFIVTTHDPLCVRGMDNGEVIVLNRAKDGRVQLIEDLPDLTGMRTDQILTSEYFGLFSTIDPEIHSEIARLAHAATSDRDHDIGTEANSLISKITVGDSAAAQIIHEALSKYLRERGSPIGSLSPHARGDAVAAVFRALRSSRAGQLNEKA